MFDETTIANHFNPLAPLVGEPYLTDTAQPVTAAPAPAANPPPAGDVPALPADAALAQSIVLPSPADAVADPVRDPNGPEMVVIHPARFAMGDPIGMSDSDARPVRAVQLDGYLIGVNEVTFNEYDRFVHATNARRPNDFGWGRGSRPVVDVSWEEVQTYLKWLSQQTGHTYRLPSEAEWEYAARGSSASSYWWGAGSAENRAVCFDCGTRWDRVSTAPAGSFAANPFGLRDTAGNAYEWVADCYRPTYHDAPASGAAVEDANCQYRVVRGGSFSSPSSAMRSHARNRFAATTHVDMIGFRVARSVGR
ncbi:SUMF1/EgtB/PvdO family nonheme iron enzyme [Thiospirillum jenense]|uniref:SUMF1/EgtB/PvdO family nonheme iron enzyme n=2 Tax=Thiospirillum jenense TaxID=1653858 RepID=A0A839HDY4_9GAMM|nr:SUMF1/EgtB/PvdO family nonheme iron enzyme [Thiospirillum jenense]